LGFFIMPIDYVQKRKEDEAVRRTFWGQKPVGSRIKGRGRRIAWARRMFGTESDRGLAAPTASQINTVKVKFRESQKRAERAKLREQQARDQRLHQLAGMPQGRGNKELKRLLEGGSLKETATEKAKRQRKAQLEGMPEGRGKKLAQKKEQMKKLGDAFGASKPKPKTVENKQASAAQKAIAGAQQVVQQQTIAQKAAMQKKKEAIVGKKK
jgi:hypothetical protein